MHIFISYKGSNDQEKPNEASIFAADLYHLLRGEYDSVFYDKKEIKPTADWRKVLEEEICRADIFIVLFAKENPESNKSYFPAELEKIQLSFDNGKQVGIEKKIISVLFDDIKIDDLPSSFKNYQAISDKNHEIKKHKIKQALDKIKQETKNSSPINNKVEHQITNKEKKVIVSPVTLLLVSLMIGLVLYAAYSNTNPKAQPPTNPPEAWLSCKPFEGNYILYQRYIFKDNPGYRIVTNKQKSEWKDVNCKEDDNEIFLTGNDKTIFGIESVVNGKFELLAEVFYSYSSNVTIDKKTRSGKRYFGKNEQTYINEDNKLKKERFSENERLTFHEKNDSGLFFDKDKKSDREAIVEAAIIELNRNFGEKEPHECHVAIGKIGKTMFAFVCPEYTRVMEKK